MNRDVVVMTVASFLSTIVHMLSVWAKSPGTTTTSRVPRNSTGEQHATSRGGHRHLGATVISILLLPLWLVAIVPVRVLSRYREFAADNGAVALTGNPAALGAALQTISGELEALPDEDLRGAAELNAFFIVPTVDGVLETYLPTHPALEERLERLRSLE